MGNDQPVHTSNPLDKSTWYKFDASDTNKARAADSVSIRRNGYTLSEWFVSPYMNTLRDDLNNDVKNPMCGRCWRDEARSGSSIRSRMNSKYQDLLPEEPGIVYLDLKLTNQCNLKCRMCGPSDSNLIGSDIVQLEQLGLPVPINYSNAFGPRRRAQVTDKYISGLPHSTNEDIKQLVKQIKVMKITGGEPTLQPEVLRLLDYAIDNGYAENIELQITTNATKFTPTFLDHIEQFKHVSFNISVDGYGKTYDYIRYPFTWDKFEERIEMLEHRYGAKNERVVWKYTCVPQMFNIENLYKLQTRVGKYDLYMNNVLHPDGIYNSLDIVPLNILERSVKSIKLVEGSSEILVNYLKRLINDKKKYGEVSLERLKDMVLSVQGVDTLRKQHYKDYLEPRTVDFISESARKTI